MINLWQAVGLKEILEENLSDVLLLLLLLFISFRIPDRFKVHRLIRDKSSGVP